MKSILGTILVITAICVVFALKGYYSQEQRRKSVQTQALKEPEMISKPELRMPKMQTVFARLDSLEVGESVCEFSTQDLTPYPGVLMSIFYPCSWEINKPSNPSVIRQVSTETKDKEVLAFTCSVTKLDKKLSIAEIYELGTPEKMKALTDGIYISGKRITISQLDGEQVASKKVSEYNGEKTYRYQLVTTLHWKDKVMMFNYMVLSFEDKKAKEIFTSKRKDFEYLTNKTHIAH